MKSQKGFGHIEELIIVLVIAAISFGGYTVWHKHKSSDQTAVKAENSKSITNTTSPKIITNTTNPKIYSGSTLVVSEWGIKMIVDSNLTKVSYLLDGDHLQLISKQSEDLANMCSQVTSKSWGIDRYPEGKVPNPDGSFVSEKDAKELYITLNGYTYVRRYPQTGCDNISYNVAALDSYYHNSYDSLSAN